jgi:hypothetical protein
MQKSNMFFSVFKKFQSCQKNINTAGDREELLKFSKDSIRLISSEDEFYCFLYFLLNNNQDIKQISNENYLNLSTKIDFSKHSLIVSHEAIIKNVFNSEIGYIIEFQEEVRGYSDYFYPLIVNKNTKSDDIILLNTKLGPYLDTKYYPEFLNNMVDLFHNLNTPKHSFSNSDIFDLKSEISSYMPSSTTSNNTTQISFKGEVKLGKVVIVGMNDEEEEEETKSVSDQNSQKKKTNKIIKEEENKETKKKAKKQHLVKKVTKCKFTK